MSDEPEPIDFPPQYQEAGFENMCEIMYYAEDLMALVFETGRDEITFCDEKKELWVRVVWRKNT